MTATHYYTVENGPKEHLVMQTVARQVSKTVATCREQYDAERIARALNKEGAR